MRVNTRARTVSLRSPVTTYPADVRNTTSRRRLGAKVRRCLSFAWGYFGCRSAGGADRSRLPNEKCDRFGATRCHLPSAWRGESVRHPEILIRSDQGLPSRPDIGYSRHGQCASLITLYSKVRATSLIVLKKVMRIG